MRLARHGFYEPRVYVLIPELRLAYLNVAKAASSSIIAALEARAGRAFPRTEDGRFVRYDLAPGDSGCFVFTVVRNPFDRLASCYRDKICHPDKIGPGRFLYERYRPFGRLRRPFRPRMPFDEFVQEVVRIPDSLADRHVRSQASFVFDRGGRCCADKIGRFETLSRDLAPMCERYGLSELPRRNVGWSNEPYDLLYTPELVELVASRYADDIERFGYEGAYHELQRDAAAGRHGRGAEDRGHPVNESFAKEPR